MTATDLDPARPESRPGADRRWWILAVLAIAQLMIVVDATIVNIALPSAQQALHITTADRQWIITAYTLTFGGLLLLGGRVADYVGRKRILIIGLLGFGGASALGGLAPDAALLFAARALQGAFAALMAPAALSLLTVTFTEGRERARAFGVYGAIAGGGAAVGLISGGVLTQYASWRWCLLVNVPIALLAGLAALRLIPESRRTGRTRYDIPGAVTSTLGHRHPRLRRHQGDDGRVGVDDDAHPARGGGRPAGGLRRDRDAQLAPAAPAAGRASSATGAVPT